MSEMSQRPPRKRKDAEIIVKRNFGRGSPISDNGIDLYEGIAVFANRRGYRFLSEYFRWLAERPIAEIDTDPGDHIHLSPHSPCCDEIGFSFDTLTPSNRRAVLRHAGAGERSRRCGTPIRQFMQLFTEITQAFQEQLSNEDEFRQTTIDEIKELVSVLEQERARLENM